MLDAQNKPINQTTPQNGTDYVALKQNNPYAQSLRKKTWLDGLVSSLGLQSGYDKYELERKQNELNYEASINQLIQQNEYNSPEEQAARMREAGMNPDLVDGVTDNTQSSESGPKLAMSDMSDVISKANEPIQKFGSTIMQALQLAFGMAESINGIEGMKLSNDGKDISNLLALFNGADNMESKFTQPLMFDFEGRPIWSKEIFPFNLENPFRNQRYNVQWNHWRRRIQEGLPYRNKRYSDIVATGKSWIPALGWNPMFDTSNSHQVSSSFKPFTDALIGLDKEIYSNTLKTQSYLSDFQLGKSKYLSDKGDQFGRSEFLEKMAQEAEMRNLIATRKYSHKIFEDLSNSDSKFDQLLLMSMALTQLGNGFDPVPWGADVIGNGINTYANLFGDFFTGIKKGLKKK